VKARIVVLASGDGSNLQALIDACRNGSLDAQVVCVISNNADAYAITRANQADVASLTVTRANDESRQQYDTRLAACVASFEPQFIVLAGWTRLLSMAFLAGFPQQVINLHPALPGEFPGTHAIEHALEAHQRLGLERTGVMVHYVPDEGVDDGPVIATVEVPIELNESLESLTHRVHIAEHALLVQALQQLITPTAAEEAPTE
jgi:phosphoribosylglycinamide formyltransferase-1